MTGYRLDEGGAIERSEQRRFSWDGRAYHGFAGDTLASALMASGERILARGFKYHRPRGVMAAGPEEGGALVTLGEGARREANAKASQIELYDGLKAFGQNAYPNVRFDLGRVNDLLGAFFAAGFYYKTFFGISGKGTWEWMQFEKIIRQAAGMGAASTEPDPDAYDIVHAHCDVLVVGAGAAGLAAAEEALAQGLDVILAEQDFALGPALLGAEGAIEGEDTAAWRTTRLRALSRARILPRTTAFGLYDGNVVGLYEKVTDHLAKPDPALPRGRVHIVRPRSVILATGAIERPFAFGDNDRPGVLLASAVETYLRRFGVAPAKSLALTTNNDRAYDTALTAAKAGLKTTLLDVRPVPPEERLATAKAAGVEVFTGHVPVRVKGRSGVEGLEIGTRNQAGEVTPTQTLYREAVGVSGGFSPAIHLVSHRGVKPVWHEEMACFLAGTPPEGITLTGAAAGIFEREAAVAHARAVSEAEGQRLKGRRAEPPRTRPGGLGRIEPLWEVRVKGRKLKSFVDPQHDVTTDDIRQAAAEGYASVEHMKRYTTLGMATDQGKTGGVVGLALLAEALGQSVEATGITTFRPPYTPVPIGAFAGRARAAHWRPTRRTPMMEAQAERGAHFTDAGLWKRAWWFATGPADTLEAAYPREAAAVRNTVGLVDVTTLGKIAVQGPDAGEFLNRVYVNGFAKLPIGRCRYGVMLRDDGLVFDDGVTWRLSENEYLMTATTAHAGAVLAWLEELLQTRWPELRVHVASTTDQWAGVALAGPRARTVLEKAMAEGDVSDAALPFMGLTRAEIAVEGGHIPALIARISFSGERAFEIYVPSGWGDALWRRLTPLVEREGGAAYGLEALGTLRIEKGHVTGAELDGRTTLEDAGLGRMASTKKPFIGAVLRQRPALTEAERPRLAHFEPVTEGERFYTGAIVCHPERIEGHGLGWITGVTLSPAFEGRWLGIGFVAGGHTAWADTELIVADPVRGQNTRVRVCDPHRYDPKGERMHG
ncbi:MAG: 2Fe-2S iron-sulfur cluster-binding protein [Pseudomonadota bacterium]